MRFIPPTVNPLLPLANNSRQNMPGVTVVQLLVILILVQLPQNLVVVALLILLLLMLNLGNGSLILKQRLLTNNVVPATAQLVLQHSYHLILLHLRLKAGIQLVFELHLLLLHSLTVLLNLADVYPASIVVLAHEINELLLNRVHSTDTFIVLDLLLMNLGKTGPRQPQTDVGVSRTALRRTTLVSAEMFHIFNPIFHNSLQNETLGVKIE
jgi:hypothetical protein